MPVTCCVIDEVLFWPRHTGVRFCKFCALKFVCACSFVFIALCSPAGYVSFYFLFRRPLQRLIFQILLTAVIQFPQHAKLPHVLFCMLMCRGLFVLCSGLRCIFSLFRRCRNHYSNLHLWLYLIRCFKFINLCSQLSSVTVLCICLWLHELFVAVSGVMSLAAKVAVSRPVYFSLWCRDQNQLCDYARWTWYVLPKERPIGTQFWSLLHPSGTSQWLLPADAVHGQLGVRVPVTPNCSSCLRTTVPPFDDAFDCVLWTVLNASSWSVE